jgi:hypothetical protein
LPLKIVTWCRAILFFRIMCYDHFLWGFWESGLDTLFIMEIKDTWFFSILVVLILLKNTESGLEWCFYLFIYLFIYCSTGA